MSPTHEELEREVERLKKELGSYVGCMECQERGASYCVFCFSKKVAQAEEKAGRYEEALHWLQEECSTPDRQNLYRYIETALSATPTLSPASAVREAEQAVVKAARITIENAYRRSPEILNGLVNSLAALDHLKGQESQP